MDLVRRILLALPWRPIRWAWRRTERLRGAIFFVHIATLYLWSPDRTESNLRKALNLRFEARRRRDRAPDESE